MRGVNLQPRAIAIASCLLSLALGSSCRSSVPVIPGTGSVWGYVTLVPHEQLDSAASGSDAYGDRRLRDARLVDYSRPGFAVVYSETGVAPEASSGASVELRVREGVVGERFVPQRAAVAAGSAILVRNDAPETRILSCPSIGLIHQIAPGGSIEIRLTEPGEHSLFLLDVPEATSTVFAAPGSFAVVSSSGRYALSGLPPGRSRLRAWHARFPPTSSWVELRAGEVLRSDLQIGVGREAADAD